ncbi:MAG: IIA-like nitrogen-regulatory protein PtsN [Verrucomicrobiaceae bacterium]|nr:IIA-like nitrogen-regulatory protein PtsN [Verrucomicrobiaceae bacterium]
MQLNSILTVERTLCRAQATSKQLALENCAQFIAESIPSLAAADLLQNLLARERLGSTGLGYGIAIPHCRLKNIDSVIGALITLETAIDFDAVDGAPVDILFVLLAPERALQEHLNALAALATQFNVSEYRQQLRAATTAEQLFTTAIKSFN